MSKFPLLVLLLILNFQINFAQNNTQYINDIVADNFRVDEKASDIGLQKKVKSMKVVFQESIKDKKSSIADAMLGYFINYDEAGLPVSYYKYADSKQLSSKDFAIDKEQMNLVIFNKNGLLEKHLKKQDGVEEIYDKNGSLIETISKYPQEIIEKISDSITERPKIEVIDYTFKKYKYNRNNKIVEQVEFETTFDRKIETPSFITKIKYNPNGKIAESESVEANTSSVPFAKKNLTVYKYSPDNQLINISNKLIATNTNFKYNAKKEMIKMEAVTGTEIKNVTYLNKRFSEIEIIETDKKAAKIGFEYTDDLSGNWTLAIITVKSTDSKNNAIENKYEIVREIQYY